MMLRPHCAVHTGVVPQALMSMLMQQCGLEHVTHLSCAEGLQPLQVRNCVSVAYLVQDSADAHQWGLWNPDILHDQP